MCGSLRRENFAAKIGNVVIAIDPTTNKEKEIIWGGFVKSEKLNWWKNMSAGKEIEIKATHFTEGNKDFNIPGGRIKALYLSKNVRVEGRVIGEAGTCKIITRPADKNFEAKIHHRFPVVKTNKEVYIFSNKDLDEKQIKFKF